MTHEVKSGELEVELLSLLEPKAISCIRLEFDNGLELEVRVSTGRLELGDPDRFLEEWNGPL